MNNRISIGMDQRERDISRTLFDGIEGIVGMTAMKCKGAVEALHTIANGLSGGIGVLAKILVKKDYQESDLQPAFTFAALLINRMTTEFKENSTNCDYHLGLLADAFADYEKLTGTKPDGFLLEPMVAAVRDEAEVATVRIRVTQEGHDAENVVAFSGRLN